MKVYVVFAGNKYEGLRTLGIFKTKTKAQELKDKVDTGDYWTGDKQYNQYNSMIEHWEVK